MTKWSILFSQKRLLHDERAESNSNPKTRFSIQQPVVSHFQWIITTFNKLPSFHPTNFSEIVDVPIFLRIVLFCLLRLEPSYCVHNYAVDTYFDAARGLLTFFHQY